MRAWPTALTIARLGLAATTITAMAYQAGTLAKAGVFNSGNFLSFFTIQGNGLAAASLAAAAVVPRAKRSATFDAARSAVAFYLGVIGLVFAVLLAGLQESLDTHIEWVNFVVHTLMPIALVVDWLIEPPLHRTTFKTVALWLVYPAVWLVYTLIRGSAEGWYPYPFVDANQHGYGRIAVNSVGLLVFFALFALAFRWAGNRGGLTAVRRLSRA